ncbi:DUF294 nucleotidyltransferase-like domain-containing protein [Vibrio marisflavi]|uniref:Cyclic nucleotide-binding domain-containing protein n=1 Tax=Vibrio marisflavi CECT 7928 TaxID=634439 RepID=A0ABN8EBZ8_9VIBR|nr:DUF294 nucleotidyltransferase-like domain-containing protein [Vibrio marisflavi]CAH0542773.1 hypothetical protein VMF7928_04198 [Vibrio marisflavi CECT 7928]
MPDKFNMHTAPFDRLSEAEQLTVRGALDIAYYRENDPIIRSEHSSDSLFVIIKGAVEKRSSDGNEVLSHFVAEDLFDAKVLIEGYSKHQYIALEDTLCYLLPQSVFLNLYNTNPQFAVFFDTSLAKKQELVEMAKKQQNLAEFILTKVNSAIYHPSILFEPDTPINVVTEQLQSHNIDAALVKLRENDPRLESHPSSPHFAIITRTDLLHAVMIDSKPLDTAVAQVASFPVLNVSDGDYLFNAMITMTQNRVKRLMVCKDEEAVGMLDMLQILSSFSTHSHVLTLRIARAGSIEELKSVSTNQRKLVQQLLENGIHTRFLMDLIATINDQIIERAFELTVPHEHHQECCLIVLGSEGRKEQILKTDQDNALILRDNSDWPHCHQTMKTLTSTLSELGYPLCPGNIMVSNPEWVKTQREWKETVKEWATSSQGQDVMSLAILSDARAAAGNHMLLAPIKQNISKHMQDKSLLISEFAKPALGFSTPLTVFGNLKQQKSGLDIKQGGIFPIVHGIRSLSLEHGIAATSTFDRVDALSDQSVLDRETGDNIAEALKLFIKLRLSQQLNSSKGMSNVIDVEKLDRAERDILRHSLKVVKKFKQWLEYHYQIRD